MSSVHLHLGVGGGGVTVPHDWDQDAGKCDFLLPEEEVVQEG